MVCSAVGRVCGFSCSFIRGARAWRQEKPEEQERLPGVAVSASQPSPPKEKRTSRTFDALCAPEAPGKDGPLTPALSPSEGARENRRQVSGKSRFMGGESESSAGGSVKMRPSIPVRFMVIIQSVVPISGSPIALSGPIPATLSLVSRAQMRHFRAIFHQISPTSGAWPGNCSRRATALAAARRQPIRLSAGFPARGATRTPLTV